MLLRERFHKHDRGVPLIDCSGFIEKEFVCAIGLEDLSAKHGDPTGCVLQLVHPTRWLRERRSAFHLRTRSDDGLRGALSRSDTTSYSSTHDNRLCGLSLRQARRRSGRNHLRLGLNQGRREITPAVPGLSFPRLESNQSAYSSSEASFTSPTKRRRETELIPVRCFALFRRALGIVT